MAGSSQSGSSPNKTEGRKMSDDMKLEEVDQPTSPVEDVTSDEKAPEEWDSLTGKTKERIQKIIQEKNEALDKMRQVEERLGALEKKEPIPMPALEPKVDLSTPNQEEMAALSRLKQLGIITREELEKRERELEQKFEAKRSRDYLDKVHEKLEQKYSKGGFPAYDRQEIESLMSETGTYDPEYQYERKYRDEIRSLELKTISTQQQPHTERTKSKISGTQPWTPETLQDRLRQPDGKEFFIKNKDKILKLNQQWEREAKGL
jgi:hypothetical protein